MPDWLDTQLLYGQLAPGQSAAVAAKKYAEFVAQGRDVALWDKHLQQQIYLGDDAFIKRMQEKAGLGDASYTGNARKAEVSKIHRSAPTHDSDLQRYAMHKSANKVLRNQNIAQAFYQGGHSQTAIAAAFGVSSSTVSRVVVEFER